MKTFRDQILVGGVLLGVSLLVAPGWGQRLCPGLYLQEGNTVIWSPPGQCDQTYEFVRPVDLDGDGVADFTHERLRAVSQWGERGAPEGYTYKDDTIEAYYPAGQVELYWLSWWERDDWGLHAEPRLPAGWELLPMPVWGKYWDFPVLRAQGLGIFYRRLQYTCETLVPPFFCARNYYGGYLAPWEEAPWTVVRQDYDQYFGFRLRRAEGWHLGWVQLRWQFERGGLTPDPVALVAWAVHPEPDAPIVVGEPARPTLQCERGADGGLVVRWSAVWTNAVLERSPSLSAPAWVPVSGVQPQGVRLTASEAQGFFRLRVP